MKLILTAGALLLIPASALAQSGPSPDAPPPPNLAFVPEDLHLVPKFMGAGGSHANSEQALRHQIEAIEAGAPDYAAMTPKIAETLRVQVGQILPPLAQQWGRLQSLKFQYPTQGGDVYEARFERARVRWVIVLSKEKDKISAIAFKTLTQSES